MTTSEFSGSRDRATTLLLNRQIAEALLIIKQMVSSLAQSGLNDEYNNQVTTYRYMLQYLAQGMLDPEREKMLNSMVESLLRIADTCQIEAVSPTSYDLFYLRRNTGSKLNLNDALARYANQCAGIAELPPRGTALRPDLLEEREKAESNIFNKIWSSFPTTEGDVESIREAFKSPNVPTYFKCMIVSALTLGLICYYDQAKLLLLTEIYTSSTDAEVQMRAIVGIVITINLYRKRAALSAAMESATQAICDCENAEADIQSVFLLLARSRNTENVSKKMSETLMSDLMKTSPGLMDKIKNRNSVTDLSDLEGNPEWQQWLDNSGISKKMKELNELQQEGNDVFIATFSQLKSYPFFQILSNWFMPFHADHSSLGAGATASNGFIRLLDAAPFLCNSDKYSLALTMMNMPDAQRKVMLSQFGDPIAPPADNGEDSNNRKSRDSIANKYIHDLYRFFKLFSRQKEFKPIFSSKFDLENAPFIGKLVSSGHNFKIVAEYYLKARFYDDAIRYYELSLKSQADVDPQMFQKMGFAYQNKGDNEKALECFKKFELASDTNVWNIKHMAQAYRALHNYNKAIEYLKKAEKAEPNNVGLALNVGHCLLEKGDTDKALNQYFMVDFMDGAQHKAWRPIAWCSFLVGNYDQSKSYYSKIINDDTPTAQDHLNFGHLLLCTGHPGKAIGSYRQSLKSSNNDERAFMSALMADMPHLTAKGISETDIHLIADAVIMSNNEQKYQL